MSFFRRATGGPAPVLVEDLACDDEPVRTARDRAHPTGDWGPAAAFLEAVQDHDRRGMAVEVLAEAAVDDPSWADAWCATKPQDGDAAIVRGAAEIKRAWQARGGGWAKHTGQDAADMFFSLLENADRLLERGVELAPDDPAPWVSRLWLAIGQGRSRADFDQTWAQLLARDPHSRLGHIAALQYLGQKWHGSHEQSMGFARSVADAPGAPAWSVVLPLQAHAEYVLTECAQGIRAAMRTMAYWTNDVQVGQDISRGLNWLRTDPPRHALALHDATVVGYSLAQAERWVEAAEVFVGSGHRAYEYPWYYEGDPAEAFAKAYRNAMRAR